MIDLRLGSSLEVLASLSPDSVDSVVTDPPYELGFMGKTWDNTGIAYNSALWKQVLRVLKPGGHLLSFGGSRTYHRMACAIEDAGFEIRDQIMWVYGSGFPKSLNIGKAVDKFQGNEREVVRLEKEPLRQGGNCNWDMRSSSRALDKGTSAWEGWGTALKPAHEPIVLARKPLSEKTVAENVLKWGVGGINIDGCRVGHNEPEWHTTRSPRKDDITFSSKSCGFNSENTTLASANPQGRFPANFIHDGLETEWSRFFYCAKVSKKERDRGCEGLPIRQPGGLQGRVDGSLGGEPVVGRNFHPTVKPIALMKYLITLVTPKDGLVLDPFLGSGSTGVAAKELNRSFVGIEMNSEYLEIARRRIG